MAKIILPPCPRCGGPRSSEHRDTADRLCSDCRNPEMLRLDILWQTAPQRINDTDYPELPEIRKLSCQLFDVQVFSVDEWNRLKKWLLDVHGMTTNEMLSMKRADVLERLRNAGSTPPAAAPKPGEVDGGANDAQNWITVSDAARHSGVNKGVISRAADAGDITTREEELLLAPTSICGNFRPMAYTSSHRGGAAADLKSVFGRG